MLVPNGEQLSPSVLFALLKTRFVVEQLDRQGSLTRGVEAGYTVALGEPQQLLALAEPRPGEAAGQELLGEQAETCGPSSVACCTTRSGARSA